MRQTPPPRPEQFEDWKEWAAALLVWLDVPESQPPVILGSRGGNVALQGLLVALQDQGTIVDKTS